MNAVEAMYTLDTQEGDEPLTAFCVQRRKFGSTIWHMMICKWSTVDAAIRHACELRENDPGQEYRIVRHLIEVVEYQI